MSSKGKNSSAGVVGDEDYLALDNLSLILSDEVTLKDGAFTLCLWIYFVKSCKAGTVIRQICPQSHDERPFLTLTRDKKLVLHYASFSVAEEGSSVEADEACTVEKWLHIGCEINVDIIRLHMDGVVLGENHRKGISENTIKPGAMVLVGGGGGGMDDVQGYIHYAHVLPQPTVTNHYVKHPPLELSLDGSTGASDDHEVEEGGDGIWSVVGGKASCRRNFALDVVLLDALGRSVHKDMEIIATLVYADNGVPVEKPKDDAEAPLLTTFDGVEFPSTERPIKLVHGRASFKLKISQLSSKCDNRLFRVCFDSPNTPSYPFLRVFSRPIRCVSRNRNSRAPAILLKKQPSASIFGLDAIQSLEEAVMESSLMNIDNANPLVVPPSKFYSGHPPTKRTRMIFDNASIDQPIEPCGNEACPNVEGLGLHTPQTGNIELSIKQEGHQEEVPLSKQLSACTSQAPGAYMLGHNSEGLSDFLVFKYCLESTYSRAVFLKGAVMCFDEQELSEFADRVSHYTACQHNGYQILISKQLIQDGDEAWRTISKEGNEAVPWDLTINHVEEHFVRLSCSSRRRLSSKDKLFLKQLAKCGEYISREEFDRLWYWIYPVSLLLSNPQVLSTWEFEDPTWIHGMLFREETEILLDPQMGTKPGTFVVRFVSTCSWPHPDAGGLIVSYIGGDLMLHHKLLSLDKSSGFSTGDKRSLAELLVCQLELSQPYK